MSQQLAANLDRMLRQHRFSATAGQPGIAATPEQLAAQNAWMNGPPMVVLTSPITTLAQAGVVVAGGGRTIIPIPVVVLNSWGVPTGTFTRTTFATSTVTTAQLAQRVAALIQDLQGTGILPTSG